MAMAIKCGNCGGYFTADELRLRKPPRYPWALTASGHKTLADNQARGAEPFPCPGCGQPTLLLS